jgi:hypothetical protein
MDPIGPSPSLGEAAPDRRRLFRRAVVIGSLTLVAAQVVMYVVGWLTQRDSIPLGLDWLGYRAGFERWLATGSPYAPFELAGPFTPEHLDFIHPPNFLLLAGPFSLLPHPLDYILWVGIPIAIFVWLLHRIPWWAYPVVAFLSMTNSLQYPILNGNSSLWMTAVFSLSLRYGWPAGLLAMKPSLLPLAFAGLRRPVPTFLLAAVPVALTLPLFPAYVTVLHNANLPLTYSVSNYSLIALALVPWAAEHAPALAARSRSARSVGLQQTT